MRRYVTCLILTATIELSLAGSAAGATRVTVTLSPTAGSFLAGEPIGLDLKITNQGPEDINFEGDYPLFEYHSHVGIKLSAATDADTSPQDQGLGQPLVRMDRTVRIIPLKVGESKTERVFLQRYMRELLPGTHQIRYSVHIPCDPRSDPRSEAVAYGQGTFEVVILPSTEEQLAKALKDHAESRGTAEAICVTNSPLAVPYIIERIGRHDPEQALECLAKFRGNSLAEAFVLEQARRGRPNSVSLALDVLGKWRLALPLAEFEQLMNSTAFSIKSAALRYAAAVRDPSYLPTVIAHVTDPDAGIAEHARTVRKLFMETK